MARYTCTVEQWSDDTDVIRLFQAEVASFGATKNAPEGWEIVSDIVELNEAGDVVGTVSPKDRALFKQLEGLLTVEAIKQWEEEEPDYGSDSY